VRPRTIGCRFTVPVRSFRGAQSRRKRTARRWAVYRLRPRALSTKNAHFCWPVVRLECGAQERSSEPNKQCLNQKCAALRPYSCVVLRLLSRDGIATGAFQPPSIRPVSQVRASSLTGHGPTGIVPAIDSRGLPTALGLVAVNHLRSETQWGRRAWTRHGRAAQIDQG
jgi:hypothetical protein